MSVEKYEKDEQIKKVRPMNTSRVRCTHKSRVSNLVFPLPVELVRS